MGFETPVKLTDNIYWVGCDNRKLLNSNVYLYKSGETGVLIDPAWTQAECLVDKVTPIMSMDKIKYVVIQNYEPDTVKMLLTLKKLIPEFKIVTHWKIAVFLNKFDLDADIYSIDENEWELDIEGNKLSFVFTPFNYFAGSFCTYDSNTKTLFSSELFSALKNKFQLFVDRESTYIYSMKTFHELYLPVEYMKSAIYALPEEINLVAPKYGSVLEGKFIEKAQQTLLDIKTSKHFDEAEEGIVNNFYKNLIEKNIEDALNSVFYEIKELISSIAYMEINGDGDVYRTGMPQAKYKISETYRRKVTASAGFNSKLKEKEEKFLNSLLWRIAKSVSMMYEKQIIFKNMLDPVLDESTGLFSRAYLKSIDGKVFSAAKRHNYPVSVALINIETDRHVGKLYKECIIRECAKMLQRNFRSSDIIIKEGENSFLIVMPFTEFDNASHKIEALTKELNRHKYCGSKEMSIKAFSNVLEYDRKSNIQQIIRKLKNFDGKKIFAK